MIANYNAATATQGCSAPPQAIRMLLFLGRRATFTGSFRRSCGRSSSNDGTACPLTTAMQVIGNDSLAMEIQEDIEILKIEPRMSPTTTRICKASGFKRADTGLEMMYKYRQLAHGKMLEQARRQQSPDPASHRDSLLQHKHHIVGPSCWSKRQTIGQSIVRRNPYKLLAPLRILGSSALLPVESIDGSSQVASETRVTRGS